MKPGSSLPLRSDLSVDDYLRTSGGLPISPRRRSNPVASFSLDFAFSRIIKDPIFMMYLALSSYHWVLLGLSRVVLWSKTSFYAFWGRDVWYAAASRFVLSHFLFVLCSRTLTRFSQSSCI